MTTRGDQVLDRPLAQVGGKGLFIKELEVALAEGRADIAVHSHEGRADGAGAAASRSPPSARARIRATPSCRARFAAPRSAARRRRRRHLEPAARVPAARARFPRLAFQALRGNVNTRLAKLDAGDYDAIILAAAGLKRLGFEERIRAYLPDDVAIPAIGQGILAVEHRAGRDDLARAAGDVSRLRDAMPPRAPSAPWASSSKAAARCPWARSRASTARRCASKASSACPTARAWCATTPSASSPDAAAIGRMLGEHLLAAGGREILDALAARTH